MSKELTKSPIRIELTMAVTSCPRAEWQPSRARCVVDGMSYETEGPASIYKIVTLLDQAGYHGEAFEVFDNQSPFGGPAGLALTGQVRSYMQDDLRREGIYWTDGIRVPPRNLAREVIPAPPTGATAPSRSFDDKRAV